MSNQQTALQIYGIYFAGRPERVTAETIRFALLDLDGEEARDHVARIDRLVARGCSYSGEDFDTLSSATAFLERSGRSVVPV